MTHSGNLGPGRAGEGEQKKRVGQGQGSHCHCLFSRPSNKSKTHSRTHHLAHKPSGAPTALMTKRKPQPGMRGPIMSQLHLLFSFTSPSSLSPARPRAPPTRPDSPDRLLVVTHGFAHADPPALNDLSCLLPMVDSYFINAQLKPRLLIDLLPLFVQ